MYAAIQLILKHLLVAESFFAILFSFLFSMPLPSVYPPGADG